MVQLKLSINAKNVNLLGRILTKTLNNHFLREQYFKLKRRYKATCKKEKRKFERKSKQNVENLCTYNKEEFWNLLKQIKANSSNKSPEFQTLPSLNDLINTKKIYFKKTATCNLTKKDFPEPLNTRPIDSLNQKITIRKVFI